MEKTRETTGIQREINAIYRGGVSAAEGVGSGRGADATCLAEGAPPPPRQETTAAEGRQTPFPRLPPPQERPPSLCPPPLSARGARPPPRNAAFAAAVGWG
jgi:hypothetical protein